MDDEFLAADEGEALLIGILPLFTLTHGQDNSVKSSYFENFCTLFSAEAQLLETWLIDQDSQIYKSSESYLEILDNILSLFESLVSDKVFAGSSSARPLHIRDSIYTKLPSLYQHIASANDDGKPLSALGTLLSFGRRQTDFRKILWELTTHNNSLSGSEENLPSWWSKEKLHKRTPAYEVRESAITLYQTLSDKWPICEKASHEALLCLSRYQNAEDSKSKVEFDLLLSTHNPKWQESKVGVFAQEKPAAPSRVRFADPPPKKSSVPQQLAKDICGLIENTARRKACLHMVIDVERRVWHTLPPNLPPRKAPSRDLYGMVSVKSIIEKLQEERLQGSEFKGNSILSLKQRRIIAVILSHSLLQFCGSAWLSEKWDKGSISFLHHIGGDRIVLSTKLQPPTISPDPDAPYRFHQYPGVLALAIILLEMELKKTMETARREQDDFVDNEEPDPDAELEIAQQMSEDIQDNVLPDFKAAIEACLSFQYFKENTEIDDLIYRRDTLYDDMALRRKIYSEIVAPLERELCISFPEIKLDELSKMPLSFSFWEHVDLVPRVLKETQNVVQLSQSTIDTSPPVKEKDQISTILVELSSRGTMSGQGSQIYKAHPIFFHDVSMSLSNESREASKKWFKDYISALDGLIDRIEYSPEMDAFRVKVAVLDTGIDWADSFIRGTKERIQGWKNFADNQQNVNGPEEVNDAAGHGTHVAALLLKTSPESDVFIARIANSNGSMVEPEKIAEAIKYATEIWGVNIITMSFGFRQRITDIDQAIKNAFSKDVIMFAAASNDGGNEEVAFPALAHETVIGINSTNVWGDKSSFTPNALPRSENFSILGEAVESSWPKHLGQGSRQWRSGTSYATPIAAGTASTMLFYARMKLGRLNRVGELGTCTGMRKLLLSMAELRDGYHYLRPWLLWRRDDEYIAAHILTTLG